MAFVDIIFVSTFRATFSFQHSELLFRFGVQSHGFGSTFRVIISSISAFRAITHLHYNIQSHYLSSFGVQSHYIIHFSVQSHYSSSLQHSEPLLIFVSAFRAIYYLHSGFQSHVLPRSAFGATTCLHLVFRAITCLPFGFQSYYLVSFDVQSHYSVRHSMLLSSSFFSFGVQSHCTYPFMHFESPHSFPLLTFRFISPWSYHLGSRSPTFVFIGIAHLIVMILAFTLTYLTQSPCAYRLFIIARPDSCSTTHDTVS